MFAPHFIIRQSRFIGLSKYNAVTPNGTSFQELVKDPPRLIST